MSKICSADESGYVCATAERLRRELAEEARRNMEQTAQLVNLAEQRRVELAEAWGLLRVFPGYGLSSGDYPAWWKRHAALLTTADQPSACAVPGSNVGHILGTDGACTRCGHWFHPARTDKSDATETG